jgi:hypothetical protein
MRHALLLAVAVALVGAAAATRLTVSACLVQQLAAAFGG